MEKLTFKQKLDAFGKFIWNKDENQVLGRGARSWGEIGVFYLVYYACLAGFFAATIAVFYETVDEHVPPLMGSSSLLKGNPGFGFKPQPNRESSYILSSSKKEDYDQFLANTKDFLASYTKSNATTRSCADLDEPQKDDNSPPCSFDFDNVTSECNEDNAYGMKDNAPCIVLKMNKIYGWIPDLWEGNEVSKAGLPDDIVKQYTTDRIWVHCKGEDKEDEDLLKNVDIDYYPMQGFPIAFFPYKNQKGYQPPLVFVKFTNLEKDKKVSIECRGYAKNIKFEELEKLGGVKFELHLK